jgi:hypothetical protein
LFVKAVLRGGHVGRGKYHEMTRFLVIDSMVDVLKIAKTMPRVKKSNLALISCEQISKAEYLKGKLREAQDPYLNTITCNSQKGGCCFEQRLHGNPA